MAACTLRVATADTGASPNTSGAFTPALNDLLIVFVVASGTAVVGNALTSSVGGFTFTNITTGNATFSTSAFIFSYVADALVSSAISQTVTWENTLDQSSGTVITVFSVSGMTLTGLSAIRQVAIQESQGAGGTPSPSFLLSVLTDNPTLGCVGAAGNPAAVTPPTGWTEVSDTGYNTPAIGSETVFRDSGFTGTTVAWASTEANDFGDVILELSATVENNPFFTQLGAAYI